jgi:hypothetical protein
MAAATLPEVNLESFAAGSIDPDAFDHDAHIYVAWLSLEKWPLPEAVAFFSNALRRLTTQLGIPGKYHETITWFFMLLIHERRSEKGTTDWFSFRREHTDLFAGGDASILHRYYSSDLLKSDRARQIFLLPDRLPD